MGFLYYAKSDGFTNSFSMQKHFFIKRALVLSTFIFFANLIFAQKFTIGSYIAQHSDLAQQLMEETGVPASVILAVAIHESAYGNSRIAKHLNNHFGIKGKNRSKVIKSAYKGYGTVLDSYRDFVGLLQRRKRTKILFDRFACHEYEGWVKGIARSGYSETRDWPRKVLITIDKYNLDDFDTPSESELAKKPLPLPLLPEVQKEDILKILSPRYYTVQPNDSAEEIASVFGVSVSQLLAQNNIENKELEIGLGLII